MKKQLVSHKVAVIGAGMSGLVAARELRGEGHKVTVYERTDGIGGTWVYNPTIESDPLSTNPSRTIVQTSLYQSLRTNLPRECMSFHDYPFLSKHIDPRRFPGHGEVLLYLEDFSNEFQLRELIRFETEVVGVELIEERKWLVKSRKLDGNIDEEEEEVYSAVVVCNGHNTQPRIAEIPGIDLWPGKQIHSHNYRVPDPFNHKVVVLIGDSHSSFDISREIATVAKEVHVASRSITMATQQLGYDNLWLHSVIESAYEDGTVVFQDGSSILVDVILHCTGYRYDFPFLKTIDIVTVDDNRVGPLYQHIFVPQLAPWISFIGLPWKVCPFPLYEMQSKWVAGILSGKFLLPSQEKMISDMEDFYSKLAAAGVPKRYTHDIMASQFDYYDWLASQCGITPKKWINEMHKATGMNRIVRPETYRDEWDDQNLILQAHEDFVHSTPSMDRVNNSEVEAESTNRVAALELGLEKAVKAKKKNKDHDRTYSWTAEIKAPEKDGVDKKYKWETEIKAGKKQEKSYKYVAEFKGKGKDSALDRKYIFKASSIPVQKIEKPEPIKKKKKDEKSESTNRVVEIDEPVDDQGAVILKQAFAKRVGSGKNGKGKKKELSPQDAAMMIQMSFRAYLIRRSQVLRALRDLAVAKAKLKEIRALFNNFSYRSRIARDAGERQKFSEKIIVLLLTVDAIEGADIMVRSARRSMVDELEAMLDVVDPQPSSKLGSMKRRKFDLPEGGIQKEIAAGVAGIVQMLDEDERNGVNTFEVCL